MRPQLESSATGYQSGLITLIRCCVSSFANSGRAGRGYDLTGTICPASLLGQAPQILRGASTQHPPNWLVE